MDAGCSIDALLYNHLVLPSHLPQSSDPEPAFIERTLLGRLIEATNVFPRLPGNTTNHAWDAIRCSLQACLDINKGGHIDRTQLLRHLRGMSSSGTLIVHVESQNAGLLIRRDYDPVFKSCVVFEAFEACPKNEDVLASLSALQWHFPGIAVAVPLAVFQDEDFLVNLSTFLEQASMEATKEFAATAFKAGESVYEFRNTGEPAIISSMLMAILEGSGRRVAPTLLKKRVRDDVCWNKASKPWRRLPLWLVLRVGIQRYLAIAFGGEQGRAEYKFFMCVVFAQFLDAALESSITVERAALLRSKLCRRLAKLDVDSERCTESDAASRYEYLFAQLGPKFDTSINKVNADINSEWDQEKARNLKIIPSLSRIAPQRDLDLELRCSLEPLQLRLQSYRKSRYRAKGVSWTTRTLNRRREEAAEAAKAHLNEFAVSIHRLTEREKGLCTTISTEQSCAVISQAIKEYLEAALPLYNLHPEQKSNMLLIVMELWVAMDKVACKRFPLLRDFHPMFYPQMLDVLLLQHFHDMKRLQAIQIYLRGRVKDASGEGTRRTIFDDPAPGCFGDRYFVESDESATFARLQAKILETADLLRQEKERNWRAGTTKYNELTKRIDETTCTYLTEAQDSTISVNKDRLGRHAPDCLRCTWKIEAQGMRISIHEHPLPFDEVVARAAIFELACPPDFILYRDTTWLLLSRLASPDLHGGVKPKCLLPHYPPLKPFGCPSVGSLTLGSTTKSFLVTHYAGMPFPVDWEGSKGGVCRPNGLKLAYFDQESCNWPGRVGLRPTFAHQVALRLPRSSPFNKIMKSKHSFEGNGPSSYEIMASQSNCPSGLNVHEFLAFQTLFSGKARRWLVILTELASTNINFSNEATMVMMHHLILQSGPEDASCHPLRQIHLIFQNDDFSQRLLEQVSLRIESLAANWRETHLMDTVITILLRVHSLTLASDLLQPYERALSLLKDARKVCLRWAEMLRAETYKTSDTQSARRCQEYALWAAILCKRTFLLFLEENNDKSFIMDEGSLQAYLESSITIQDNLTSDVNALSTALRNAIISESKLAQRMADSVRRSVKAFPVAFRRAIAIVWREAEGSPRELSPIGFFQPGWMGCVVIDGEHGVAQTVEFNYIAGLLLVQHSPIGKLPERPEHAVTLRELFGDHSLLTYPSGGQYGLQYTLCIKPKGFQVHIGLTDGKLVVRAVHKGGVYEFVDREVFRSGDGYDLPGPLINNCVHWMDLRTGDVYISPFAEGIWSIHRHKWILNLNTQRCIRSYPNSKGINDTVTVVDPYSPLFFSICRIFQGFEEKQNLLVIQPSRKALAVQINRRELYFFVNPQGLLQSPQLGCEIDPDQDAGTWYGLVNKLVCRDERDPSQRCILVPLGNITTERSGCHVLTRVMEDSRGRFGKFKINKTLGRLDCAVEPMLLYTKAQLHAYTSFVLPDPLTGRTGTEEALHWLASAICKPWEPLTLPSVEVLAKLAELSPRRDYYPEEMKTMKTDFWGKTQGTEIMHHEAFRFHVHNIMALSHELERFAVNPTESKTSKMIPKAGDIHLHRRGMMRRQLYDRSESGQGCPVVGRDQLYSARDCVTSANTRHRHVIEVAHIIHAWPGKIPAIEDLAQSLSQAGHIIGYVDTFDKVALTDRLKLNVRQSWGQLVKACREQAGSPWALVFLLAPASFHLTADMPLIRTLVAFAVYEDLRSLVLPQWEEYADFQPNQVPQLDGLLQMIRPFKTPPPADDRDELREFASAKETRRLKNDRAKWDARAEKDCDDLANFLLRQWPCAGTLLSDLPKEVLVDTQAAMDLVRPAWQRQFQNFDFSNHLKRVQAILTGRDTNAFYIPPIFIASEEVFPARVRGGEVPLMRTHLLKKALIQRCINRNSRSTNNRARSQHASLRVQVCTGTPQDAEPSSNPWITVGTSDRRSKHVLGNPYSSQDARSGPAGSSTLGSLCRATRPTASPAHELETIIARIPNKTSVVRRNYAQDLKNSLDALVVSQKQQRMASSQKAQTVYSERNVSMAVTEVERHRENLTLSLSQSDAGCSARRVRWLQAGQVWPAVTSVTLLEQLRSTAKPAAFGKGMREGLLEFGIAITHLQRELRLNESILKKDAGRYDDDEANPGHTNWHPADRPDWLLLEIEANLLIRPDQVDVALATISPSSGRSSVLQMNMGQGKTSCIIPMVCVALADRELLVRVVEPKALLHQTAPLLKGRVGVLLNRQVLHVPFSRRTPTNHDTIQAYLRLHKSAQKDAAVMVCQPEHNLSFMQSGLQRLLDNHVVEASAMITAQSWLKTHCRDILDESDYTLAVRTQLVYPSGSQITVDGHPHRWQIAEAVLHLADRHLDGLCQSFPQSVEVVRRSSEGFPLVHFLRSDAEEALIQRLTTDIINGVDGILPMQTLQANERIAVKDLLGGRLAGGKLQPLTLDRIRSMCPDRPHVKQAVYLLRGLLVNRILMMTLKKRWNVQYGLHPQRDPIAVPFHAKGVPSDQSEWGHPDVGILLTCLAFYYDGIDMKQLQQSLEHVLKSDDPSTEYDKWTQSAQQFPGSLKAWNSINVDDEMQLTEIWRAVRHNTVVIDYFLNNFVFPCHAKQFTTKLQSNGWDIPLYSATQEQTKALTTGFSGTNDNRTMLPLNIEQADLPALAHTNAEVLTYLLHERSRKCVRIERNQARASKSDLLQMLKNQDIRILIDAGAVILEMSNGELARKWLKIDPTASAALYFDQANKPWVITSTGISTPLLASPFSEDLSDCLVYLDEAHTRGTDLKLPSDARGALTLGLGQTKDHTVQAAMRLRQLATTQSVTFFIPPEVYQSILDVQGKDHSEVVESQDVIGWLLHNTCDGLEQLQPLFYSQGVDFCRRQQAAVKYPNFLLDKKQREAYTASIKQAEQQSLQQLYEPKVRQKAGGLAMNGADPQLVGYMRELEARRKGFQDTGRAVHASALQEVEQEREVAFEVESVRQVKKMCSYPAYSFSSLHPEIETFARTGRLPADSRFLVPAFQSLARTGVGRKFRLSNKVQNPGLFVSAEFERTVKVNIDLTIDNFIRPVNWILWSQVAEKAVIVIPEEAEALLPILRGLKSPAPAHLLMYAAPITRKMLHFGHLNFFTIPSLPKDWKAPLWLRVQLGIYAGRLYFDWEEYEPMCKFFGIDEKNVTVEEVDDFLEEPFSDEDEVTEDVISSADGAQDGNLTDDAVETVNHTVDGAEDGETTEGDAEESVVSVCGTTNGKLTDAFSREVVDGAIDSVVDLVDCAQDPRPADFASKNDKLNPVDSEACAQTFTTKPLTFMQEWLATRRHGQDFVHTPMGFIAQGKALHPDHAFFRQIKHETRDFLFAPVMRASEEEDADNFFGNFDGVGDMGANVVTDQDDEDAEDQEVENSKSKCRVENEDSE